MTIAAARILAAALHSKDSANRRLRIGVKQLILARTQPKSFKNAINFRVALPRWLMAFFTSCPSSAKVWS